MIDRLVRRFVKDSDNVTDEHVRTAYGMFAGVVGIICNVALCVAKGAIGILSGSVSIVADALNNLSDASSNIITLAGFKLASRPADDEHPYGHGRFEYLSCLAVSVLILVIGVELVRESLNKIIDPEPIEFSLVTAIVLLLSIAVKWWMQHFNATIGTRISSDALQATAVDSRNDVITTAAVLAATAVSAFTNVNLDGWAGLAVGAFIIVSGIGLLRDAVDPLLGRAPDPETVKAIHDKIMSYPGVLGTHDLMVHDYGPGRRFASAHVEMAAETDPLESHDTLDNIEEAFKREDGLLMVLHYDPIVTTDTKTSEMRTWVADQVKTVDPRLTIHDFRTVPGPTHTNVIFDVVRPHDLSLSEDELKDRIAELVCAQYPKAICKITVDSSYVSAQ